MQQFSCGLCTTVCSLCAAPLSWAQWLSGKSIWLVFGDAEKLNPQNKILGYQPKIKLMDVWTMYFARYLGLGIRYGGGTCTIVISMNGVFKDVRFAVSWDLTQNHEKPWIIAFAWVRFLAKIWPTLKSMFRTSFESSFHADHNGTIPSFIFYSHTKIWCVFHLTLDTWSMHIYEPCTMQGILG